MKAQVIHYAGALRWTDKRGATTSILGGWAACCSGRVAEAVRRDGNHTLDPKLVTCKKCLIRLAWAAGVVELTPTQKLERAEKYIADLEDYIERQNTCVVCSCCLHPPGMPPYGSPPHCEDSCRPEEEHEIAWHENYLDDPVKQLRAKHGRAP